MFVDSTDDIQKYGAMIWDHIYQVRMAYKDTKSIEYLKHFGLPSVGNRVLDRQIHNERIVIMIPIDDIFEHWRGKRFVEFVNNSDVESIYNTIFDYLSAWNRQLSRGVNVGNAPLEDLVSLDEFAKVLFEQSRMFNGPRRRSDFNMISSLNKGKFTINRFSLLGLQKDGQAVQPDSVETHNSFAESFAGTHFTVKKAPEAGKPAVSDRWRV